MKYQLIKLRIDRAGYQIGTGHYYGVGQPIYWCCSDDMQYEKTFRACGRANAKAIVLRDKPNAVFYR